MKQPLITKLNLPKLLKAASHLAASGKLAVSSNNLAYIDIEDAYIHQLFHLLPDQTIKMPDYFGQGSVGAHITVIYPEENKQIHPEDLGQTYNFLVKDIVTAGLGLKTYYVLLLESPSLLQLRRKYALPDLLCFKGFSIGFHITIGVHSSERVL